MFKREEERLRLRNKDIQREKRLSQLCVMIHSMLVINSSLYSFCFKLIMDKNVRLIEERCRDIPDDLIYPDPPSSLSRGSRDVDVSLMVLNAE